MRIDATYPQVSQFERGESAYECGFFTVALQKAAGPGHPLLSAEAVDQLADRLYTQMDGPNTRENTGGMSLQGWYACLKEEGIAYESIHPGQIQPALDQGHAVCVTVAETSVHDLDLGDRVPYAWTPSGNHIITIVGSEPGAWLCLDTANIGSGGIRPWPRRYDAGKLQISLATAILFPWLDHSPAYTIQAGDTLGEIAEKHGIWPPSVLYAKNASLLEETARAHGYRSSEQGRWIFPGTVLRI